MEESSRRSILKTGVAAVGGVFGLGLAAKVAANGLSPAADTRAQHEQQQHTLTFDGRSWHLTSPTRRAGEFPVAGEQMVMTGELVDLGGKRAGDFYGTYFGLTTPGRTGPDGS